MPVLNHLRCCFWDLPPSQSECFLVFGKPGNYPAGSRREKRVTKPRGSKGAPFRKGKAGGALPKATTVTYCFHPLWTVPPAPGDQRAGPQPLPLQ